MKVTLKGMWIGAAVFVAVFGITVIGLTAYGNQYHDRVLPGIHVGKIAIGGMSREELTEFLERMNDKLVNDGLHVTVTLPDRKEEFFSPIELLRIDIPAEVERLLAYGKNGNRLTLGFRLFQFRLLAPHVSLRNVEADGERIIATLQERLASFEQPLTNATVKIHSIDPLRYDIRPERQGKSFRYEQAVANLIHAWAMLETPQVTLEAVTTLPEVTVADVEQLLPRLPDMFDDGAIGITHTDPRTGRVYTWQIEPDQLGELLEVQRISNGEFAFGLRTESVATYLHEHVAAAVEREPMDAIFEMSTTTGKVTEFQGSRSGVILDSERTALALRTIMSERSQNTQPTTSTVLLATTLVEPNITTGEANDLGITELLGVGISRYAGSPPNRIKNIHNAVNKLNGLLVKPGEEFSALKYTEPFTLEGGYLPELVIKGDQIKPEIGGGLCQIGTTLFRMAMKSGMPITARRNHSLVVSYYNDLENGLPGTDATVYDPAPDFRFKNDTGNYILVQTEMDASDGFLYFSLWGKSDGRKGTYTQPEVLNWISHGPTKTIETTTLAPGVKKCQHAYRGAETAFTYTRELPDGTKDEKVFESYYRPLPEICLVGVEEKVRSCEILPDGSESCTSPGTPLPDQNNETFPPLTEPVLVE